MKRSLHGGFILTQWERSLSYPADLARSIKPFTFAVVADPHCVETTASVKHGCGLEYLEDGASRLKLCFDAIRGMDESEKPIFLVLLGDIGIEAAEPILDEAPCLIHAIAGNHDWGPRRQRLRELFPPDFGSEEEFADYYTFEYGGVRFVAICNAGIGNEHVGQLSSEDINPPGQAAWIDEQLRADHKLKILLGHCPPQPEGFNAQKYLKSVSHRYLPFMGECDSIFLNELLVLRGPITAFFGHLHRATYSYGVGPSRVHILRSCNWNHANASIGFMHVRVDRFGVAVREVLTGVYR